MATTRGVGAGAPGGPGPGTGAPPPAPAWPPPPVTTQQAWPPPPPTATAQPPAAWPPPPAPPRSPRLPGHRLLPARPHSPGCLATASRRRAPTAGLATASRRRPGSGGLATRGGIPGSRRGRADDVGARGAGRHLPADRGRPHLRLRLALRAPRRPLRGGEHVGFRARDLRPHRELHRRACRSSSSSGASSRSLPRSACSSTAAGVAPSGWSWAWLASSFGVLALLGSISASDATAGGIGFSLVLLAGYGLTVLALVTGGAHFRRHA